MVQTLRKLTDAGIAEFREWLQSGATGPVPVGLLGNPETSEPFPNDIVPENRSFTDRYEFGKYLNDELLADIDPATISRDIGFWTAMAIIWFDQLCPPNTGGNRKVDREYRYILASDYRHYYRHLVRSPWQLVKDHGENARVLLIAPKQRTQPLSVHGEILEQIGGRQQVLASKPIISAANKLYFDTEAGRPRRGAAGSGRGSARRFGLVLRQFDLTYDPEGMPNEALIELLPREFDRWN